MKKWISKALVYMLKGIVGKVATDLEKKKP